MIYGIGIDIIEIERIKQSIEQYGDRFLNKIFTKVEIEYSKNKSNMYQHLAARFAAKEAIAKAISTGLNKSFSWQEVEIYNEPSGLPQVKLLGKLKEIVGYEKELKITMSHSDHYVCCFAILFSNIPT
ncbi:MAG: holo-ACP synthase [Ignavibacteriales bacterium]|nr:holo-ACP synthase [Ignavibacteriales bacterium]